MKDASEKYVSQMFLTMSHSQGCLVSRKMGDSKLSSCDGSSEVPLRQGPSEDQFILCPDNSLRSMPFKHPLKIVTTVIIE